MKFKHVLLSLGLALTMGVGVATGIGAKEAKVAKAEVNGRFSILVNNDSWWKNDSAQIFATYSSAGEVRITPDSDIATYENGFSWVTIGGVGYGVLTMEVDTTTFTYDNFYFQRKSPSGDNWGSQNWTLSPAKVKNGTCNAVIIDADSSFSQDDNNYWKITTYYGTNNDYSNLSAATKACYLDKAGSYTPADPDKLSNGYEFQGWYTNPGLTSAWGGTLSSDVTLYAKYNTTTVDIYKNSSLQGESFTYNSSQHQWEGIVSFAVGDEFVVRKIVGAVTTDYGFDSLEDGSAQYPNAKYQGKMTDGDDEIVIAADSAGAYSIYLKDAGTMWIQSASASDEAYMYGTYFLTNVGCAYPSVPSGWSTVKTRYASVSNAARTIIAGKTANVSGDEIEQMLYYYTMALTNHASLRTAENNFLVDGSGDVIVSPTNGVLEIAYSQSANATIIIIMISAIALIAAGGFFLLRKKREN
ncbi:MAG: InlB B-repeat-containing protein [Bacilli bacterium]|nr:InlB B-repeat-containing protein [Bacilli bacterium]